MNIVQQKLVNSYTTLVIAKATDLKDVPEIKVIGGTEYPIRSEVEIEIAQRTVNSL
ncbi:hypothetical protein [Lysinibacillus pakistanensis]|uniref:hypothetical protein n=1 Tax=Lysinibacillus pakistanensis TaxID=759811 RepID=UPI003D26B673